MPRPVPHKKFTYCEICRDNAPFSYEYVHMVWDKKCKYHDKKYTHFPESEITGSYHNDKEASWLRFAVTTIIVVSLFAALLILGEFTGLTSKLFGTV